MVNDGLSDETRLALSKMTVVEKYALCAAANALEQHGIYFSLPWNGIFDDRDDDRFNALREACAAYRACFQQAFVEWIEEFIKTSKNGFEPDPEHGLEAYQHFNRGIDPSKSSAAIQEGRRL